MTVEPRWALTTTGLGLLVGAVTLAQTAPLSLDISAFREKARKIVADGTAPSVVVALARNGQLIWSEGFGFADREAKSRRPLKRRTRSRR